MPNVTQEDLSTKIADIEVHEPNVSEARKDNVYHEIRLYGALGATYKNISNYNHLYDILVRKYRGFNKFARINVNKKARIEHTYLLEKAVEYGRNEAALLLLKLGADPTVFQSNSPLRMILRRESDTRLLYFMIKAGSATIGCEERLLTAAVENNDIHFVRYLVAEKQIDINLLKGTRAVLRYAQPEMLEFLMDKGVEFDLADGRILKNALEYGSDKNAAYERFCFLLKKGAGFDDQGIGVLKKAVERNNLKVVEKILDTQEFTKDNLADIFFKQKYPNILSAEPKDVTKGLDALWFSDVISHHITSGNASMLKFLIKEVPSFTPHIRMTEMLIESYKKVNTSRPESVRTVLWESADYDAKALMSLAVKDGMWTLMQDLWKKYPDVDFSDTDQQVLGELVKDERNTRLIDRILKRNVTVTPEMLQDVMEGQVSNIIHRLVSQEPYAEKSNDFKQAYKNKDKIAFKRLMAQYVDHDDFDWEALNNDIIVHHQGEGSDRTRLKIIFNFAVDTVTTVIYDQENDQLPPAATSLGFMQISNDIDIQRAHEKLKKFGKKPPENFETGAMGLGRRKTVLKLSK